MIGLAELCKSLQQHGQIFLAREAARVYEQAGIPRKRKLFAQIENALSRRKNFGIHSQRLMRGVMHTEAAEIAAHEPARRENHIESLVEPAHVTADGTLARAADAPTDNLRKVRMVEGRERNTATLRHTGRTPRGVKCIADFDQIRLELIEQLRPATRVERKAVIESAGHRVAFDAADAAALDALPRPGHEAGMSPRAMRGEPRVLGSQIALDAAARRRIKQSRIDEVHALNRRANFRPALHLHA